MPCFLDAHCHLQDEQLASVLSEVFSSEIRAWIVNGTSPADWGSVAALADRDKRVIPAFGWHPWELTECPPEDSFERLRRYLELYPNAHVGEIGVDRWKEGLEDHLQIECLVKQIEIAAEFSRPVTLHCLKAWELLEKAWKEAKDHPKRMLLHAFNGSIEIAETWIDRGGYFSFSTYFLHARKEKIRTVFAKLPIDRLLLETDAPAMAPPSEFCIGKVNSNTNIRLNHPVNIKLAYSALADIRSLDAEQLEVQVGQNFEKFNGSQI
ncbi:MAG: TatD family hydrolase [Verrucomicrobiota bacterium]